MHRPRTCHFHLRPRVPDRLRLLAIRPARGLVPAAGTGTASAFRDEFIDVDIDASQIFWVLTANSTEGIPHPLLNRMAVYEVPAPTPEQAAGIAQRMYAGLLRELNLAAFDPSLGDVVLDKLATVSPRDLRKTLLDGLGYAAADGRDEVTVQDLHLKTTPGKARIGF